MAEYRLREGSIHEKFFASRKKIQMFGGGYANGKTAAMCVRVLELLQQYPGMNALMGRATYPKLKDTLQKEFFKWCPPSWIEKMPTDRNNTCYLKNIAQQGSDEHSSSNLLSATYDLIAIDQIEDPEFGYKDFLDLVGRLRGSTPYRGDDPTMPLSGPRWMLLTTNPTSNWVYSRLVKPYHEFVHRGRKTDGLLLDKNGVLLMDLVEGSTYENAHVLPPDAIELLETTYTGQYRQRYLLGEWAAFEGLVYRAYSYDTHVVAHDSIMEYLYTLSGRGIDVQWLRGYDYGISVPSAYLAAFVDHKGNVIVVDGFYEKELEIIYQVEKIREIDDRYMVEGPLYADPSIFKRSAIGQTVAKQFEDAGVQMRRGVNDIMGGISKINTYLNPVLFHRNPFTNSNEAPSLYFSSELEWLHNEIANYHWQRNTHGARIDKPVDKDDHALDALKYLMTPRDPIGRLPTHRPLRTRAFMTQWQEPPDDFDDVDDKRSHRYG